MRNIIKMVYYRPMYRMVREIERNQKHGLVLIEVVFNQPLVWVAESDIERIGDYA